MIFMAAICNDKENSEMTKPTVKDLRDWADNPAATGMVPVSPKTLLALADQLETLQQARVEPVPFDDWPEFSESGMGCGLEDRGIQDRYEAMRYGWDEAIEQVSQRIPVCAPLQIEVVGREPFGWGVSGLSRMYTGKYAELDAASEAKRCGGTSEAFPIYTGKTK